MTTLAIDFGTSNTVLCVQDPVTLQPETLELHPLSHRYDQGPPLVPTLVYVDPAHVPHIGQAARQKRDGSRLLKGFKRELSQAFQPAPTQINNRPYSPQDAAHLFLSHLFKAIQTLKVQPTELIFSAPVGAYETYLRCLSDIATEWAIPKVRFIDESTAAALGYGIDQPGSLVLVIDLGGGTLDLSLVRILKPQNGDTTHTAEVIAKADRAYGCGGLDIDTWIAQYCLSQHRRSRQDVAPSAWQNLLMIAEAVKIRLSAHPTARESFLDEDTFETWEISLNREELEQILETEGFLGLLRDSIDETLEYAYAKGISKKDIHHVLMVGGSSLIPALQAQIISQFGRDKVHCHKPFEAVAHGALSLTQYSRLDDHLRHTYALRLHNPYTQKHDYHPLFESGSTYPAELPVLPLQVNQVGQREIQLTIGELSLEGSTEVYYDHSGMLRTRASDADSSFRPLGKNNYVRFILDPPGQVGMDRLEVTFRLDSGRTLRVSVKDIKTQKLLLEDQIVGRLA